MAKKRNSIHDKFTKASFSKADRVISFFERYLPQPFLEEILLDSLTVSQESYLQNDLSEHFSDMVFEVKAKDGDEIDLVLLFEHKSSPDKHVLVQVGHYMFSHWYKCVMEGKQLKIIIPILYYQGKVKWEQPVFSDLFPNTTDLLASYIPLVKNIFIALNSIPDESITQIRDRMMAAAVMAQKKGVSPIKLAQDLVKIFKLFPVESIDGNFLEQIFVYIITVSEVTQHDIQKVIDIIPSENKDIIMTTLDKIKEAGRTEGISQGITLGRSEGITLGRSEGITLGRCEGKTEGRTEKEIEIIINSYDNGIEIDMICNITQLSKEVVIKILMENGRM